MAELSGGASQITHFYTYNLDLRCCAEERKVWWIFVMDPLTHTGEEEEIEEAEEVKEEEEEEVEVEIFLIPLLFLVSV